MQAEKLAMQTILVDAENQSDQAFETVRRLSSKMERMKVGGGTRSAGGSASSPSAREDAENAFVNERIALHSESRKARAESYAELRRPTPTLGTLGVAFGVLSDMSTAPALFGELTWRAASGTLATWRA